MEQQQERIPLRCNINNCAKELTDLSVVTICCHLFCRQCAVNSGLAGSAPSTCPACRISLEPADIFEQHVNPGQAWMDLALCGLDPITVTKAAGRSVAFWCYQMGAVIGHHNTEKDDMIVTFNAEIQKLWTEASQKMAKLQTKMSNMERVDEALRRRNQELELALEDMTQQFAHLRGQYDALKNKPGAEPEPTGITKFRGSVIGSGSRLPRLVLPGHTRNIQGSYFPSVSDYPEATADGGRLSAQQTHQSTRGSRSTHPTGTVLEDWNMGQRASGNAARPVGLGATGTSTYFPEGNSGNQPTTSDPTGARLRYQGSNSQHQQQDTSKRFPTTHFGVTSSRSVQPARDYEDPRHASEKRDPRVFPLAPPAEQTITRVLDRQSIFRRH